MQPSYSSYDDSGNGYIEGYGSAGGGGGGNSSVSSPYANYGNTNVSSHQLQYAAGGGGRDYDDDVDDIEEDLMQRASMLHVMSEQEKLRYARDMTTKNRR